VDLYLPPLWFHGMLRNKFTINRRYEGMLYSSDSKVSGRVVIAQPSWICTFHYEYSVASGNTNEWSNPAAYTERVCRSSFIHSFIHSSVSCFIRQMDRFLTRVATVGHTANSPASSTALRAHLFKRLNPLALELDIHSLAHHLCKVWIFYEPRRVTLGNTRHFVEEQTKMVR